ncbi:PTS system cellobiose-specific IIC component [Vagococcus fluvialis]|uniref:Permease IIC component n=1 Tax=Vagococcus fluvialis TaxID=2738 RepID=A0A369B3B2_9ENTE|nr:PTS transporter subunit EIIC [Vagococcus fluvialis]RCX14966.1 PTS system cellobiose-specific IIC component [Vagococcus fluvialis]RSU05741.1 PTS sugar transporter subunit IIBC [Vagococcus fluvialis]UDM71416.1 PTS transporter subunit EIIC [Vagococcus fluvialis]UDM76277.1 PTS transporter subunit EIIC [Vagococcus fluvialis]UDM83108.1 PTS transporter subunit EIIC [Vagococcus fluvialis]
MGNESKSNLIERLNNWLSPIATKIGNQRHLKSISTGMFLGLPFMVVGAFFLILANPPINIDTYNPNTANFIMKFLASWKDWAVANYDAITTPYTLTFGIIGLISAFGISYSLSKEYDLDAATNGLMTVVTFLLVCTKVEEGKIKLDYLGSNGLFVAIILGLLVVEVSRLFETKNIKLKMPDSVPPMVSTFINSLLPLLANIIIFYGINLIFISAFNNNFPGVIMDILTPGLNIAGSLGGMILIVTIGQVLWLFGINGTSIIFPILFTLGISQTGMNAEQFANGEQMTHLMNLQMFRISVLGGAGNTLGLVLLMMYSKVPQFKMIGRLSFIPGICSINEPVIFGLPIVFNPILGIPFVITPIVSLVLTYFAEKFSIITNGYIVDPSFTPFFIQSYLSSMDWKNVIFTLFLVVVSVVIYYPFFKVFEKTQLETV